VVDKDVILVERDAESSSPRLAVILQGLLITGTVTDAEGEPLPGVAVIIKGTTQGTATDANGAYSLPVQNENATLVFSYIGFTTQEMVVGNKRRINITLNEDAHEIEEIVVVGYGTQRKSDLTVSVSQIKGEQLVTVPKTNVLDALGGRAAGVDVISQSGAPGSKSTIRIRGANSIRSGADPLYVVDGFPVATNSDALFSNSRFGYNTGANTDIMSMINPNDIESIELLKDAAATAIYGARGANGVVLISTKTGKAGKTEIGMDVNYGLQNIANQWKMMNAEDFSQYLFDAYSRGGVNMNSLGYNPARKQAIPVDYNTNWVDEILQTGVLQDYTVSFSGGTEKSKMSGSVGYMDSKGIIQSNFYKRYSARLNAEAKGLNDKIKIGLNSNFSYVDQKSLNTDAVYGNALRMAPNYPVYFPDGTRFAGELTTSDTYKAYDILWDNNYGVSSSNSLGLLSPLYPIKIGRAPSNQARIIVNAFASLEIVKGLVFKTSVGGDFNYSKMKFLNQSYGPFRPSGGSMEHKQTQNYSWLVENTLSYQKQFDKHSITALLGQSAQKYYQEYIGIAVEEYTAGKIFIGNNPFFVDGWKFDIGNQDLLQSNGKFASMSEWAVASYFGRINYSFDNRYLVTATVRRDGSSKFGKDNKWGVFPGISAAWNVTNESFFEAEFINSLKVRGSWGVVGNGNIDSYESQALMERNLAFLGLINTGTFSRERGLVNSALTWESTREIDFGFDSYLFNRLSVTADLFWKKTYDLLYGLSLPYTTGFSSIGTTNFGSLKQFGVELSVGGDIIRAKNANAFNWNAMLNLDHMQGKIVELPAETKWVGDWIRSYRDEKIGRIYGYKVLGIYNNDSELSDAKNPNPSAKLGDYRYADIGSTDENGKYVMTPDGKITDADRTDLGNVNPIFNFGFNNAFTYRGFDLTLFFRGSVGNKIYNRAKHELLNTDGKSNLIKETVNRWTPENHNQTIQAANSNRSDPTGMGPNDLFVENGSYLRLSNMTFGYNLNLPVLNKLQLKQLRIYFSANNLFVITGYSGLDPEIVGGDVLVPKGIDYTIYPRTRTFSMGLNVKF
jgi:TonB-linked SusC/RagA family outer membrane protein